MFHSSNTFARLAAIGLIALGTAATAQDLSSLSAVDVLKLQVGAGQTADQLEEQLADQLVFDANDQFANRAKVKSYAQDLATQGTDAPMLSAALPIREITYDFDLKTYKLCLPSSILYKSQVEGGTVEALISIAFDGLAEENPDTCSFFKNGFVPGGALGVANYMEIEVDMSTAEKLHNSIVDESAKAIFTCEDVIYVQGRFDTGPTQLLCATTKVNFTNQKGQTLSYSAEEDDSWITRSGDGEDSEDMSEDMASEDGDSTDMAEDDGADMAEGDTPTVFTEGTVITETALALDKAGRIEVQRRLNLLGYNTRGVDGVFGPGTRAGITQWQIKNGMPVSGYLALDQLAVLNSTSETLYQNWLATAATSSSKSTTTRRKYYRGADGCLRRKPGNARRTIIPGQSKFCNKRRRGKI